MEEAGGRRLYSVRDILTETQLNHILKEHFTGHELYHLQKYELRPAMSSGLMGFLGDHLRLTLHVKTGESTTKVHLFIKTLPIDNEPKAKFISEGNFFKREMVMFQLFQELRGAEGLNPWCSKAFVFSENIVVMPDLAAEGYSVRPQLEVFDLQHTLLVTASVARFHAAFTNFQNRPNACESTVYHILQQREEFFTEANFCDTPWLHVAAYLTADFVETFSEKYRSKFKHLKEATKKLFLTACDNLKEYQETLNVLIHRDLWVNNIMFKYSGGAGGAPTNALLIDFQCVRCGPPAFDVSMLLYLTTSRSFREQHELDILHHYYSIFTARLDLSAEQSLMDVHYTFEEFQTWYEKSRLTGAVVALSIFPYVLMEPRLAQRVFDDAATFERTTNEDRRQPVLGFAASCPQYRDRILEVAEEFVERYVAGNK